MKDITLIHGEALEEMDKLIAQGVVVDSVICDPPYQITACKWDKIIPFEPMWDRLNKLIKPNGAIVLFGSEPFSSALRMSNIKHYKYDWVWEKERPTNIFQLKRNPAKVHEIISIFNGGIYYPIMEKSKQPKNNSNNKSQKGEMNIIETFGKTKTKISKDYNPKLRYPRSVLKFNRGTRNNKKSHPTQKPVELMEYLIKTYANENETVLDFTMGSGTTLVACQNLNRRGIGIELEKKYFDIATDRLNNNQHTLRSLE